MSKFCRNCGKQLVDGTCPSCVKENNSTVASATNMANEFFKNVKQLAKSPVNAAKKLINKEANFKFGLGLIGVVTLVMAIFIFLLIKEGENIIATLLTLTAGSSSLGNVANLGMEIPYGRIITFAVLFFILSALILAFSIWATYKLIFKKDISFKKVITFIAITYLPIGMGFLVAIPVLYIAPKLLIFVLALASMAYSVMHIINIKHLSDLNEDKNVYVIMVSFISNLILQYIILGQLLPSILF